MVGSFSLCHLVAVLMNDTAKRVEEEGAYRIAMAYLVV
jgi:hypothetical protein